MNLVNEKVDHITFKGGEVIQQESNHVIIKFSDEHGTKRFVYPDAFKGYMKLQNTQLQEEVLGELQVKQVGIAQEKETRLQEYKQRAEFEKLALKAVKKKAPRKTKKIIKAE